MKNKLTRSHVILFLTGLVVIALISTTLLVRSNRSKDSTQQVSSSPTLAQDSKMDSADGIDYSPAKPSDNEDINNQKESGQLGAPPTNTTFPTALNIVLTRASQAKNADPLEVRAFITPVTSSGTCTLVLSKSGSAGITKSVSLVPLDNYSTCENLDISADQFESSGTWDLSLVVIGSDGSKGEVSDSVEIMK